MRDSSRILLSRYSCDMPRSDRGQAVHTLWKSGSEL